MVNRNPKTYNWDKLEFNQNILPGNLYSKGREGHRVEYFVVHHMIVLDSETAGRDALTACRNVWVDGRAASAHYGVDGDYVEQFVFDGDTAWSLGNWDANLRSISVEHANKTLDMPGTDNDYVVDEKTFFTGARLIAYGHLSFNLVPKRNVTVRRHGEFSSTACPGPYMVRNFNRYFDLVHDIYNTAKAGRPVAPAPVNPQPSKPQPAKADPDRVAREVVQGVWGNGNDRVNKLRAAGYDPADIQNRVNLILGGGLRKSLDTVAWEVIRGEWGNDPERSDRLHKAGYNVVEVQSHVNQLLR